MYFKIVQFVHLENVSDAFEGQWVTPIFDLLLRVNWSLEDLLAWYQLQIIWSTSKWYSWCILGMSLTFNSYFSRSNKSMEGLLAAYHLHKSSNQLENDTVDACVECLGQVERSVTFTFWTLILAQGQTIMSGQQLSEMFAYFQNFTEMFYTYWPFYDLCGLFKLGHGHFVSFWSHLKV